MSMFKHKLTHFLFVVFSVIALPACTTPLHYSAEVLDAKVIDADTKQPLEGVIVTANWQLYHSTVGGRVPGKQLMVLETVTDKEGKFTFPAWGPKLALSSYLDNDDPQLLLFKPGYEYQRLGNPSSSVTDHSSIRHSQWNGKTIAMKVFKGSQKEYAKYLSFFMGDLRFIEDDCQWKNTPKMLLALQIQADKLKALGIVTDIYRTDFLPTDEKKCGSVKEFFRKQ